MVVNILILHKILSHKNEKDAFQSTNFGALAVKLSKTACPFMSVLCCAGRGDNCRKEKHFNSLRY